MRLLLNQGHWFCFAIAALIALDSGIAATYGHYAARAISRAASVLP